MRERNYYAAAMVETGAADVMISGLGKFCVKDKEARKGRNPQTGKEINIPARNVPKFVPGKALKDAVKEEKIYLLEFDAQLVVDLKTSVSRADRLLPMAKDSEKLMSLLLALLANPNGPDHYVYFIL